LLRGAAVRLPIVSVSDIAAAICFADAVIRERRGALLVIRTLTPTKTKGPMTVFVIEFKSDTGQL
jgi:hypothetical protein